MTLPESFVKGEWIGVGYEGVLVKRRPWFNDQDHAIPAMIDRVKGWLDEGRDIRIVANLEPLNRCVEPGALRIMHGAWVDNAKEERCWLYVASIRLFCVRHFNVVLPITNVIDAKMRCLWDCKCEQVEPDTGRRAVDAAFEQGRSKK